MFLTKVIQPSSVFSKEPDLIQSYSSKWDHIRKVDEEERLRDLKSLQDQSESHIVELIIVLAFVALILIIFIKCVCDKSPTASAWFNAKYRPANAFSRRASQTAQTVVDGTTISATPSMTAVTVPACKLCSSTICSCPSVTTKEQTTSFGSGKPFGRKKSQGNEYNIVDGGNPYSPTTAALNT